MTVTVKSTTFDIRQTPERFNSLFCKLGVITPCTLGRLDEIRSAKNTENSTHCGVEKLNKKKVQKNVC